MKLHFLAPLLVTSSIVVPAVVPIIPAQAIIVYDPSNYAQNLLTASRALQQINNQIQALQNQATMLTNMAKHLQRLDFSSLSQISQSLQKISRLMTQAEGIAFSVAATDEALKKQFPTAFDTTASSSQIVTQARERYQSSMQGYRQTMRVQAQVVENIETDGDLLKQLVTQSQSATGSLAAQQATNQLIALVARQQLQIQQLMATQYRADAIEQARKQQDGEAAREQGRRFIGNSTLYTRR
ncbi:P-type conjugative transfer protein TrbJ [Novosphingobium sp. Rr 2-17]|uniref:P-type conjugative transfer protein TrbJ n=1 Tax=Novosphingobium sp. Rr 2-17 TaxID=555793 RepID=UPI0002698C1F|nr:P-type conjugative transfer protein TrbJ [Novosphingobium sp. Rr 2-17]EIZ77479.1 P-type conjugative transfer protein TrbJ [Novosphingobium sp. Rr 2-17]